LIFPAPSPLIVHITVPNNQHTLIQCTYTLSLLSCSILGPSNSPALFLHCASSCFYHLTMPAFTFILHQQSTFLLTDFERSQLLCFQCLDDYTQVYPASLDTRLKRFANIDHPLLICPSILPRSTLCFNLLLNGRVLSDLILLISSLYTNFLNDFSRAFDPLSTCLSHPLSFTLHLLRLMSSSASSRPVHLLTSKTLWTIHSPICSSPLSPALRSTSGRTLSPLGTNLRGSVLCAGLPRPSPCVCSQRTS